MSKTISLTTSLTVLGLLTLGTQVIGQTGPVREGVRRTGEAVADGTRAVVRGSREAVVRTGQAARNAAGATIDAARAPVDRAVRNEPQANIGINGAQADVNAQAGPTAVQANADLDANQQQLNADGQIQGNLNDPNIANDPNREDRYESGYRGVDDQNMSADQNANAAGSQQQAGQVDYHGQMYNVRHDRQGREFICVGGCPVYLDNQASDPQSREAYKLSDEQMQNRAAQGDQQFDGQQGYQGNQQPMPQNTYRPQGDNSSVPAPPVPVRSDTNAGALANPSLNADTEINAEQSKALNDSADINAAADVDANDQNDDSKANESEK